MRHLLAIFCLLMISLLIALPWILQADDSSSISSAAAKKKKRSQKHDEEKKVEEKDAADKDYSKELPRIKALEPKQALASFQVHSGFRIQQVAAEPLVSDPVAMAFDEYGRMFVAEMRGYSEDREKKLGCIKLLEDTNHDGICDKSTVYIDSLMWPTAVTCYNGGIFVIVTPDILYCKDTTGDGKADLKQIVFTGFGSKRPNVQGLPNTLKWAVDNRIHGLTSSTSNGAIRSLKHPKSKPISIRGRNFAIHARSLTLTTTSGGGQHGMSFDRWGDQFVCSNSNHIQQIMFEDRYVARNPYLSTPTVSRGIASDGPAATVFRISPVEPWRIVRTRLRVKGIVKGVVEGGGKPAGYFTGATGVTIYRGDAWPKQFSGNAFIGDAGGNLVHRKRIDSRGIQKVAHRADKKSEFVASKDIWFRPVQFANAPDGNLYIVDTYREVIEHPWSLPPAIKKHLDLTSGRNRGRIYRVVTNNFKHRKRLLPGNATTAQLVEMLGHENGWHRETAARLLYEKQDPAAVELLIKLAKQSKSEDARVRAMYALNSFDALSPEVILANLEDTEAHVRRHAIRLSETLVKQSPRIRNKLCTLVTDTDERVRYQLAFSLGEFSSGNNHRALATLLKQDMNNPWIRMAVMSSVESSAADVFHLLAEEDHFCQQKNSAKILESLSRQVASQNRKQDLATLFRSLPRLSKQHPTLFSHVIREMTRGAGKRAVDLQKQLAAITNGQSAKVFQKMLVNAEKNARDEKKSTQIRVEAILTLKLSTFAKTYELLEELIDNTQPLKVQQAALSTLGQFDDDKVATIVIKSWRSLGPQMRGEAQETLFSRKKWIVAIFTAIEKKQLNPRELDPSRFTILLNHRDQQVQALSKKWLKTVAVSSRSLVIKAYQNALKLTGNPKQGRIVFRKNCATCHRLENFGHEIGLNLASIRNKGAEAILLNVLDPNREVNRQYVNYQILTNDGRTLTGMIAAETATSITLKRAENVTETILRIDIDQLRSTGKSIMPEGLEKQLNQQAMADVIAYLMSLK